MIAAWLAFSAIGKVQERRAQSALDSTSCKVDLE